MFVAACAGTRSRQVKNDLARPLPSAPAANRLEFSFRSPANTLLWSLCFGEGTKSSTGERNMKSEQNKLNAKTQYSGRVFNADCIDLLPQMREASVDFVL